MYVCMYVCTYVCMYVCTYVQFAQIKLVQLTTLYDYELRAVCKKHLVHSSRYCTEHEIVRAQLGLRASLARRTVGLSLVPVTLKRKENLNMMSKIAKAFHLNCIQRVLFLKSSDKRSCKRLVMF